jgi:hypothetical protein
MKKLFILFILLPSFTFAGSFPGAAGSPGSDAIYKDSSAFVAWASGNLTPEYGTGVDAIWKTPEKAYGPATDNVYDIVCLGNGGKIVMVFPRPITDGVGADFAVFENAFGAGFLEIAYVEVSSDGVNFYRFPNRSEGTTLVGAFSQTMDPTTLSGLASKYIKGYGTPFDLASLTATPLLDRKNVRFIRIVDIIGDGSRLDSTGQSIYDPTPTTGSGGFDLDAIGVIHQSFDPVKVLRSEIAAGAFRLGWESNPGTNYGIETSIDLETWTPVQAVVGNSISSYTEVALPLNGSDKQFWRVVYDGSVADIQGPEFAITSRIPAITAKQVITLQGIASDSSGVARVQFKIGKGRLKTAAGTSSWKIQIRLKKGVNKITFFITDISGNVTQKVIKVIRK